MQTQKKLLLAIDDSEASMRAVTYAAHLIGSRKGFGIRLLHILPAVPSELHEYGSDDPRILQQRQGQSLEAQARWLKEAEQASQPLFDKAKAICHDAGVAAGSIATHCVSLDEGKDVAEDVLQDARAHQISTIVVGRESFSGLQKLLKRHVADILVRKGQGLTVWVVE
jgi:nucleotide-binding universal stress UspA family protein